jgi:hypothetical protein
MEDSFFTVHDSDHIGEAAVNQPESLLPWLAPCGHDLVMGNHVE